MIVFRCFLPFSRLFPPVSPLPNFFISLQGKTHNLRAVFKMMAMVNKVLDWIRSLFWKEEMELTLVGLQNSGKTTFVNVIAVS